uniref:zinc finger E-box-binding homeobox 1 isoform X5 n=1 Tax=Halichoerus grypus TaxID=9711 RepID=UPI0016595B53|nr:zinc finger E-box-binding homeobox 1 isoform X5 [Halichoerus grypus]XP_035955503.1 zinc finger E-box-binding homeobox 1 isoform X5 [Halichoerus grypus]XP_035955504.1 zinc finger E-box-binding homeobox 1 isoform X5 [Halichoerus grypus]XP_035955505.1 zinc finger E-box-binding homeobox 1 isoform X5 [Halichoerus grypus]XP_035955506.1 zinc finger E-box-binding homeobox 1 isoform X5 [Halichoerus grypus]XP_035955507.1 zinc finger E-box-binding homeobox 1 isoform X5 [Halichoerus grypus]XP_03595550
MTLRGIVSVTNYNTVVETNSDSDDEDKLHIVEEESITDAADCEGGVPEDDLPTDQTVLPGSSEREGSAKSCWEDDENSSPDGITAGKEGQEILGPEAQADEAGCAVKDDECDSDAENEQNHDPNVEEFLQQQDTAVIYPEAPEEDQRQGTPEASGHDDSGTPDAFSQLLTCPYCDRGYKRFTSLKEHIKYRHEKNEDNFSCSLCSYTFAYRTQLERHMTSHKSGRDQRHVTQSGGNRKFKCTECGKAFKYKHHLKEHLRIHSGEKPYECPNCKKRFSHSGSYSSHISSKKCISLMPVNGRPRTGLKTPQCSSPSLSASPGSPTRPQIRQKIENKPLQEQLSINQIKTEPVDYEFKPIVVASGINCSTPLQNGVFSGGGPLQATSSPQGVVQAVVLPTVGLVSPISINLSDIQNVLKVAVDGNVIRQVLENNQANLASKEQETINASSIQQGGHSVISAISLPLVDQDGTTKIIINYSLEQPSQLQVVPQNLKKENPVPTNSCKSEKLPEDLTVKSEKDKSFEGGVNDSTCLLCDECPGDINALPELKHYDLKQPAQPPPLPAPEAEKPESSVSSGGDGSLSPSQPPLKNLLSLLKAYYALNAQPSAEELSKIADSVNLPLDVVKKWFEKMQAGQISVQSSEPSSPEPGKVNIPAKNDEQPQSTNANEPPDSTVNLQSPLKMTHSPVLPAGSTVNGSRSSPSSPSPLNLSSSRNTQGYLYTAEGAQEEPQVEPLDLSLPKQQGELLERSTITSVYQNSVYSVQEEPLNLSCAKKEPQKDSCVTDSEPVVNVIPPSANPINIAIPTVTAQLPTIVAIADQNSVPCLRALAANKQTILIPQVAYTYSTTVSPAVQEPPLKVIQPNGNQDERQDTSSEGVSNVEDQNDSDSTPPKKKMRKTENGMYACDLCDKIFQKSSSLLRHKYEHTGKRPHECGICKKAFKHKHHLIEHMRLHSGEKPYQCDKCGKRFSHSGSYSQHMNHRYSYCKREAEERDSTEQEGTGPEVLAGEHGGARASPSQADSDERESLTREEDEDSEKEEEEEEDKEMEELQEEKECEKPQGEEEEEEEEDEMEEEEGEEAENEGEEAKTEGLMKEDEAVNQVSSFEQKVSKNSEQVSEEKTNEA